MTVNVPFPNQFVVFWLDPRLTLETYGDDDDPELMELVSKLPCKKYVGRVSRIITGILPNLVRPYKVQFVTSKKSPACPAVLIDEDMAVALEPNTQSDLPFPAMPTHPPLPWADACLPFYFECNILCRPFKSEVTPTMVKTKDTIEMEMLANETFRERRHQLERLPPPDDSDSEHSCDFDTDIDNNPGFEPQEDDDCSALSNQSSEAVCVQSVIPLEVAARADPLGRLWWDMKNYRTDFSERPAVQLSTDLSLVPDLSTIDPFDFAREYQALLRLIAEHKARKIAQAQEQNELEFKDVGYKRGPKQWAKLLSRKLHSQRLYSRVRSRLSAVFARYIA